MTRLQLGCLALVIAGALPLTAAVHPIPPPPAVSVMDWAELLGARARRAIADYRDRLRKDHDIDYRLVTARGAGDVHWASHEAFAALQVGERSGSGRGLLLVIDPGADRVRLEVGGGARGRVYRRLRRLSRAAPDGAVLSRGSGRRRHPGGDRADRRPCRGGRRGLGVRPESRRALRLRRRGEPPCGRSGRTVGQRTIRLSSASTIARQNRRASAA